MDEYRILVVELLKDAPERELRYPSAAELRLGVQRIATGRNLGLDVDPIMEGQGIMSLMEAWGAFEWGKLDSIYLGLVDDEGDPEVMLRLDRVRALR